MLKVRLSGTKKELRWFLKKMQRDCRWQVRNISNFSSIERTNGKYWIKANKKKKTATFKW